MQNSFVFLARWIADRDNENLSDNLQSSGFG